MIALLVQWRADPDKVLIGKWVPELQEHRVSPDGTGEPMGKAARAMAQEMLNDPQHRFHDRAQEMLDMMEGDEEKIAERSRRRASNRRPQQQSDGRPRHSAAHLDVRVHVPAGLAELHVRLEDNLSAEFREVRGAGCNAWGMAAGRSALHVGALHTERTAGATGGTDHARH